MAQTNQRFNLPSGPPMLKMLKLFLLVAATLAMTVLVSTPLADRLRYLGKKGVFGKRMESTQRLQTFPPSTISPICIGLQNRTIGWSIKQIYIPAAKWVKVEQTPVEMLILAITVSLTVQLVARWLSIQI